MPMPRMSASAHELRAQRVALRRRVEDGAGVDHRRRRSIVVACARGPVARAAGEGRARCIGLPAAVVAGRRKARRRG